MSKERIAELEIEVEHLRSVVMQTRAEIEEARKTALIQITEYQELLLRTEEENQRLRAAARQG